MPDARGANERVVSHLTETRALRDHVESRQVMRLVSGIATVADASGISAEEAAPMLGIVIDGILRDSATS